MRHVQLYIDLAFCLLVLPLMIYIFPIERWWGTYPVFFSCFILWLYCTYFLYKGFIVPGLFRPERRLYAVMAIVISLGITFLFSSYKIEPPYSWLQLRHLFPNPYPKWGVRINQQAVWVHYLLVVTICFAIGMLHEVYRQRMAREELEIERHKAELSLYKAQINPHFLFNTLNTIYGLLITHSDKTAASLERFINLTRYMYDHAHQDFIPLQEEVEYIGQYIDLQRLRLNGYADVRFTHEVDDATQPLPPMMLITFIENAFKYGISSCEPCFVHIDLRQRQDTIRFTVDNSLFERTPATVASQKTGIKNCLRRLALLYPKHHKLEYGPTREGTYHIMLELQSLQPTC